MESRMPLPGSTPAAAAAGDVASRAHNALDSAVDKASPAVNRIVDKAHATIDRVAQSAVPAAEAVQSAVAKTQEKSTQMMEACASKVREQPLVAIGVAAAVGYIMGRLMR
ncbi:MAG: hypothetical protein ABJB78_02905 [Betaproteobacteria bacterium]